MRIEWWEDRNKPHYSTETAVVDVGVLKQILAWSEEITLLEMPLNEVERVDTEEKLLWFRLGGHRSLDASCLMKADPAVPVILGFLPSPISPEQGRVFWACDVVDGFHRMAVAKMRGMGSIPMVRVPEHIAIGATRAKQGFTGSLYRDPNVRAPDGYWELLEAWKGKLVGLRGVNLAWAVQRLVRDFAGIGVGCR